MPSTASSPNPRALPERADPGALLRYAARTLAAAALCLTVACPADAPQTVAVAIAPTAVTLVVGATQQFAATVTGTQRTGVVWSVEPATGGTISNTGLYTAPASAGGYTVRATAQVDSARSATAAVTVTPLPPVIASFTATPAGINAGQTSTLAWTVTGAATLSIDQGIGDVTSVNTRAVTPSATTTYTLTATNPGGSVTAQATVTVSSPSPPAISAFAATPASIAAGQSSTLAWTVTGATSLSIDQGIGAVTGTSKVVSPAATTTYTLTAANAAGSVTAQATVTVGTGPVPPAVTSFTATPSVITAGQSSTLAWTVTGATSLSIDQGVGAVTGTSKVVAPAATATYTLTATNASGSVTAQATVTVNPAPVVPVISTFTATPSSISAGQSSTLAWTVTGASSLSLDQGVGTVTGTSKVVTPAATTTYTLTATNAAGSVTAQATVTVTGAGTPPVLSSFTATPAQLTAGASTTLAWTVTGATLLSIDQGVGTVTGTSKVVSPAASTTYLLTATNSAGSLTLPVTVTVYPATPGPVIHEFAVEGGQVDAANGQAVGRFGNVTILSGGSAVLRWAVANAAQGQVSISPSVGTQAATGSTTINNLQATTTYTLSATGGGKSATAQVTVAVNSGSFVAAGDPGGAEVTVTVNSGQAVRPISPLVYGYNTGSQANAPAGATLLRLGGNRWTAWNWENNYSNAGSDYGPYHNDNLLSSSTTPGAAIKPSLDGCQGQAGGGCATLITVPLQGWVSADANGNVSATDPQIKRFFPSAPRKGSTLALTPDTSDKLVYEDELVHWIDNNYPQARTDPLRPIFFSLDNEPDLWSSTHAEIQRGAISYADLISKSIQLSAAIKDLVPPALVFGPVSYGWAGYQNLQNAPDAGGRDFLDTYLAALKSASEAQGQRLLDVLDLHFYSEASGGGVRINNANNSTAVVAARVQATRSLWESTYVESSWITGCCVAVPSGDGQPGAAPSGIDLVPRMLGKIAARYPGTRLAITEYNHGGGDHVSGTVAQADTLGIFGRTGVHSATYWALPTVGNNDNYTFGAWRLYRNHDGSGGAFGDTSIGATSSDQSKIAVHASMNAGHPERIVVVLLNRDSIAHSVALKLTHTQQLSSYTAYQIAEPVQVTSGSVIPKALGQQVLGPAVNAALLNLCLSGTNGCTNSTTVPPLSATTLVLQ